jgi:hypothetical protein
MSTHKQKARLDRRASASRNRKGREHKLDTDSVWTPMAGHSTRWQFVSVYSTDIRLDFK